VQKFLNDALLWTLLAAAFFAFSIFGAWREGFHPAGGYFGMIAAALLMSVIAGVGRALFTIERRSWTEGSDDAPPPK
jgi:hypothetical protein